MFFWTEHNRNPPRSGAVAGVPVDFPPAGRDSRCVATKRNLHFCCLNSRWLSFQAVFLGCLFENVSFEKVSILSGFVQRKLQFKWRRAPSVSSGKKKKELYENTFQEQKSLLLFALTAGVKESV